LPDGFRITGRAIPSKLAFDAAAVGQDEKPFAKVSRADFLRAKDSFRNRVTSSSKLSAYLLVANAEVVLDVFEEDDFRLDLADDAEDVRPEVPRIFRAAPLSGDAERLAGIAGSDDMNAAAPRPAVKGLEIRPNRGRIERAIFHARNQFFGGSDFVFHEADRASAFQSQSEAEIDSRDACAEADDVDGR
jgi:hypothetical protein